MLSTVAPVFQPASHSQDVFLTGTEFTGRVSGPVVLWNIAQQFENRRPEPVELVYYFPVAAAASILEVTARIGSRNFTYEVSAREKAQLDYSDKLAEGNSAILIQQDEELRYHMQIGNLLPGEQVHIRIKTAQLLETRHGALRLAIPTCLPNGYSLLDDDEQHVVPVSAEVCHTFKASLALGSQLAKARFSSPSHKLRFTPGDQAVVETAGEAFLDHDFVIDFDQLPATAAAGTWLRNPHDSVHLPGQYLGFMNLLVPEEKQFSVPVELKLLLDCSGSMNGGRIESAKAALKCLASRLTPADRVSFTRFGSRHEHLLQATAPANERTVSSLVEWIQQTSADFGGTEMARALKSVTNITQQGQADVLLITDGEVQGLEKSVKSALDTGHRIFILAIGASPQESLLSTLARATGGAVEFVQAHSDIEAAVLRLFNTLRSTTFKVEQLQCTGLLEQSLTAPIAGFQGCDFPLLFTSCSPASRVAVHVQTEESPKVARPDLLTVPFELMDDPGLANALCKLWAARRVERLLDASRLEGRLPGRTSGQAPILDGLLNIPATELAVRFGLLTPLTSACMVMLRADAEKPAGLPQRHAVPGMLTADSSRYYASGANGSSSNKVFFSRSSAAADTCFSIPHRPSPQQEMPLYNFTGEWSCSPRECQRKLIESARKGVDNLPSTFADLLALGFPDEVLDWCRVSMVHMLLAEGEEAVDGAHVAGRRRGGRGKTDFVATGQGAFWAG